jgi:molybdate transport system substrate-binding protein
VSTAKIAGAIAGGEAVEVVIMSAAGVDDLIAKGYAKERVDLARCGVGVAVRAGALRPDLSSGDALKRAVLAAKSIVYSTGPSGVYLEGLFERMGIAGDIAHKVKRVQGEPAGALVERGEAEIGFQQVCELLPVQGIDFVGPLPADVQEITTFSAGVLTRARDPRIARELVDYFRDDAAKAVIRATGMDPV